MRKTTRYTFEVDDFNGLGQVIVRNTYPLAGNDIGFLTTVAYKIGYVINPHVADLPDRQVIMIALSDGGAVLHASFPALVEHLNTDEHGYRPASQTELDNINAHQGNRFELEPHNQDDS